MNCSSCGEAFTDAASLEKHQERHWSRELPVLSAGTVFERIHKRKPSVEELDRIINPPKVETKP